MSHEILKQFESLPRFSDGMIDYSSSDIAPVVTVFVEFDGKILLLKRSDKVRTYRGLWNTVAGYIDEDKSVEDIARKELREELGIGEEMITSIKLGESFRIDDEEINKSWIVYPALALLKSKPEIMLDWEHSEYVWIDPVEIDGYKAVYKLNESLKKVLDK